MKLTKKLFYTYPYILSIKGYLYIKYIKYNKYKYKNNRFQCIEAEKGRNLRFNAGGF